MISKTSTKLKIAIVLSVTMTALLAIYFTQSLIANPEISFSDHAQVVLWKTVYALNSPISDAGCLRIIHEKPDTLQQAQCIACHGYMRESRKVPENSVLGMNVHFHLFLTNTNYKCMTCHKAGGVFSAARRDRHGVAIGKSIVKNELQFGENNVEYGSILKTSKYLCVGCHENKKGVKAAALLWTKPHLENEWMARHGMVSRRNKKACIACHDSRNFCSKCHMSGPDSHGANWRPDHRVAYKVRPDYCETCHDSSYCNERCHAAAHSENWSKDHYKTVFEKGDQFCMSCHYTGQCAGCHSKLKPYELYGERVNKNAKHDDVGEELKGREAKDSNNLADGIKQQLRWEKSFPYPIDIDIDKTGDIENNGSIYVTDAFGNSIQKLDADGNPILKWGGKKTRAGELHNPSEIVIDGNGDVVVTDIEFDFIKQKQQAYRQRFTTFGKPVGNPKELKGIQYETTKMSTSAIDEDGNKYEVDRKNYCVKKYAPDGKLVATWGGKSDYRFDYPHGILFGEDGHVYVLDWKGQFIQKYSTEGKCISKISGTGSGEYEFRDIKSIAVDKDGNVYVADAADNHIRKFDKHGRFIIKWGDKLLADGELDNPRASAVDNDGNIYVVDSGNDRVQKFDSNGKFLTKWGSKGIGNGQFYYPTGIAIDKKGNIYIADAGNDRIQKFSREGKFVTKWNASNPKDGHTGGRFGLQKSLATDGENYVYVADADNNCIIKFTMDGKFISTWGKGGSGEGDFKRPLGITVSSDGIGVYVIDEGNSRIQAFLSTSLANGSLRASWGGKGSGINQFEKPSGIVIGNDRRDFYIADTGNCRILCYRLQ